MKYLPKVGEPLYLQQRTGSYYVDLVKTPWTVIEVKPNEIVIQRAKEIFPVFHYNETMSDYYKQFDGQRVCFYDTLAESIEADPFGRLERLHYAPKKEMWQAGGGRYPEYAYFGKYEYFPYLD